MCFLERFCRLIPAANVTEMAHPAAPHYSTESGEDLSTSCKTVESAMALAFWMAINEQFDGKDRIDSSGWRA
jgi:hypothetical protein